MCAGVAAEIYDSSQIKYRFKNARGLQTLKNKLKTVYSNRLFQNTNKTAKQEHDPKDFTGYKKRNQNTDKITYHYKNPHAS